MVLGEASDGDLACGEGVEDVAGLGERDGEGVFGLVRGWGWRRTAGLSLSLRLRLEPLLCEEMLLLLLLLELVLLLLLLLLLELGRLGCRSWVSRLSVEERRGERTKQVKRGLRGKGDDGPGRPWLAPEPAIASSLVGAIAFANVLA